MKDNDVQHMATVEWSSTKLGHICSSIQLRLADHLPECVREKICIKGNYNIQCVAK